MPLKVTLPPELWAIAPGSSPDKPSEMLWEFQDTGPVDRFISDRIVYVKPGTLFLLVPYQKAQAKK